MSYNINDICRVCLVTTSSRKNSNLFFSSGRSIQLWAKVMACAWVQVFEGDGLPSQICCKCHDKLDIAYQFKQQCEASDVQIRQYLNRSANNKVPPNNMDMTQSQPECLADCKPLNFNITSECLDLAQTDLSLPAYRLMSQDAPLSQIDFKIRENDLASMKQEPGFVASLNLFNPMSLSKDDCQLNPSFKCESFNENDAMLDSLSAKLFESVNESINQGSPETVNHIDSKLAVWDLQQKHAHIVDKNDYLLKYDSAKDTSQNSEKDLIKTSLNESEDLSFLADERSVSPIVERLNLLSEASEDFSTNNIHSDCAVDAMEKKNMNEKAKVYEATLENTENVIMDNELKPSPQKPKKKADKENKNEIKYDAINSRDKKEVHEQCELCGKVFKYRSYMVKHLRTHTGVKPYECADCDQKFAMYHSLIKHMRTHSGEKPFICAVCGKRFTQSAGLKSHMRVHSGDKPFACEICAKTFSQKSNLLNHKLIHSGQRDHICNICCIAFKFYKHLQSHMKLHSDQKEFKCSVCLKSFHRKSYLRTHLAIHSGERPYKCSICGHAFSNSSNLRAHSRTHSGLKPYKCKTCKKAFAQSSALNRHMRQHTLVETPGLKG